MVLERIRGRNVALLANRVWLDARRDRLGLRKGLGDRVHAKTVFDGVGDERLGEHGAVQVTVQVRALRHRVEESAQQEGLLADFLEPLGGARLGLRRLGASCAGSE
jgi:hypothetical protein